MLIKDEHTTGTMELDDGARIEAAGIIRDLDIAMAWVRCPGRTNGTATAGEIDFALPDGAAEFHGGLVGRVLASLPGAARFGAITLGHVIVGIDERCLCVLRDHEHVSCLTDPSHEAA
jgi:hypothetical protein